MVWYVIRYYDIGNSLANWKTKVSNKIFSLDVASQRQRLQSKAV